MTIPDQETLHRLYWDENKTQAEIADMFDRKSSIVGAWMKKYGIPTRDVKAA